MDKVLLYNVGVSEITIKTERKYKEIGIFRPSNLRNISSEISSKLENTKFSIDNNKIYFKFGLELEKEKTRVVEIEINLFQYYLKKVGKKDNIIFVATDQKVNNEKDTLFVAKILKEFSKIKNYKNSEIKKITFSPVNIKRLLKFYNRIIKDHKDKQIIANITSGTPAQTAALSLLSLKYDNLILFYKPWDSNRLQKWQLKKYLSQL